MNENLARPWTYIELSNGGFCLVDQDDVDLVSGYRWRWRRRDGHLIYVVASGETGGETYRLHRLILGAEDPDLYVDHVNGNGLDNRRSNLRVATNRQNQQNRRNFATGHSPYKGVTLHKKTGRWQTQIKVDGVNRYLGLFDDPIEAALAYDRAALEAFGEWAAINFPAREEAV